MGSETQRTPEQLQRLYRYLRLRGWVEVVHHPERTQGYRDLLARINAELNRQAQRLAP